jgi:hypothetical protein
MKLCYTVLAALVLAGAGASSAATPDQVGTWIGSLKTKVRTTTSTRSVKNVMKLEIAANDITTVTLDGGVAIAGGGAYTPGEGFFVIIDISGAPIIRQSFCVGHFKGTKVKGAVSGIGFSSELVECHSGKFSLKKQP